MKAVFRLLAIGFAFVTGANLCREFVDVFKLTEILKYFIELEVIISFAVGYGLARLVDKGLSTQK